MLFGINMKFITEKICIDFIKEEFPKFIPYWEDYIRKEGQNDSINIKLIPFEKYTIQVIKSNDTVKSVMGKVDKFINWIKEERRDSDIHRSSTVHYPDWNTKKKEYVVPPNQRKG